MMQEEYKIIDKNQKFKNNYYLSKKKYHFKILFNN